MNKDLQKLIDKSVKLTRQNPIWNIEHILQQLNQCDQFQLDIINAVFDVHKKHQGYKTEINHEGLNRITVVSCHGTGKTHLMALIAHVWNWAFKTRIVVTAPKQDQIKTRFMSRYRAIRNAAPKWYQEFQTVNALNVEWAGNTDWGVQGETASDPDNMSGYHDKPQLFLIDEASSKNLDPMFPVIEGALSTKGSVLVMIGNPTRAQGEFWASHNKKNVKDLYFKYHIKPEMSRRVDEKWMNDMAIKHGVNSTVYKVRCLGEFVDQEENQLIAYQWLVDAVREWEPDGSLSRLRISVDVADGGEDESIVIVARLFDTFTVFLKMYRFSFSSGHACKDLSVEIERISRIWKYDDKNGDDVVVDSIGVGAGLPALLIDKGLNVVKFKGGSTENIDTKQYRNQRVRSYLVLRDGLRDENIVIDEGFCSEEDFDDFTAQACSIKTKAGLERVEDLVSKVEMKTKGIKSPDMPDAASMIFATMSPEMAANYFEPILVGQMESANADW